MESNQPVVKPGVPKPLPVIHRIENRSPIFYRFGLGFALSIIAFFLITSVSTFIATEFWQQWVFSGTMSLGEMCETKLHSSTDPTGNLRSEVSSITCRIPTLPSKEIAYAHFGWVRGENVSVMINGRIVQIFQGTEKFVTPVRDGDIVHFDFYHSDMDSPTQSGFVGMQKPALAQGNSINGNIFGLEILLGFAKTISNLIPVLSLGLVIALAWFGGFRTRSLLMGLHVLIWAVFFRAIRVVPLVTDLNPIDIQGATLALRFGFAFSVVLFQMEVAKIFPKQIYPIARVSAILFLFYGALVSLGAFHAQVWLYPSVVSFMAVIGLLLLATGYFSAKNRSPGNWIVTATSVIAGGLFLADAVSTGLRLFIIFSSYAEFLIPVYVSVYLLIMMSKSDLNFRHEKATNVKLTGKIEDEIERVNTLSRFLPKTLVNRFRNSSSIDENLSKVLSPRQVNVAVLQADLRGFSSFVRESHHAEVLATLKECFGPVVDTAQNYAMVKLIGDCLFAFVEESTTVHSTTDRALEIATMLVRQIRIVNSTKSSANQLRFGIAIHYGTAIVGNLSSDQCIDYTAIGETVNLTARLEELSKNPNVAAQIGRNAIILSDEARSDLNAYSSAQTWSHRLSNLSIRSFDKIKSAWFLKEEDILKYVGNSQAENTHLKSNAPEIVNQALV